MARSHIRQVAEELLERKRKQAMMEQCTICGANSDMFKEPGKKLHAKYVCPNCQKSLIAGVSRIV